MATKPKKGGTTSSRITAFAVLGAIIVAAGTGMWFLLNEGGFKSQTDAFVFVRDATQGQVEASSLVSTAGPKPTQLSKVFTEESVNRYGADTQMPDGVGLTVTLRTTIRGRPWKEERFAIPAWSRKNETENPARNALVKDKEAEFNTLVASYLAPVALDHVQAVVLDTTNGLQPALGKRVREVIDDACRVPTTHLLLYRITDRGYQGGRVAVDCADASRAAQVDGWLGAKAADAHSSVYMAVHDAFSELADYVRTHPNADIRADVFTDGLENTSMLSFYQWRGKPQLISEHAGDLDKQLDIAGLRLAGMEVHLHPLPEDDPADIALQERALEYLGRRIGNDGAQVHHDPF